MTYPDVYGAVMPVGTAYDSSTDPSLESAIDGYRRVPQDFSDLRSLGYDTAIWLSLGAIAAPNLDASPFYMDMLFEIVDGEAQVVPEVLDKIIEIDTLHDLDAYLAQPARLNAILLVHGEDDYDLPLEQGRAFSHTLTKKGFEHEMIEVPGGGSMIGDEPGLRFFSETLTFEED